MTAQKTICKYVDAVLCRPSQMNCEKCGWNPEVSKRRLEKIKKQRIGGKQSEKPIRRMLRENTKNKRD